MTGNELQHEANVEQARHNKVMEDQGQQSVDNDQWYKEITATNQQRANDIQQAYNNWYAEYSEWRAGKEFELKELELSINASQGEERLALQREANGIQQQIADADGEAKKRHADYESDMADVAAYQAHEDATYKRESNKISSKYNSIMEDHYAKSDANAAYANWLQHEHNQTERSTNYANYQLNRKRLKLSALEALANYTVAKQNATTAAGNLALQEKQWEEAGRSNVKSSTIGNYVSGVTNTISSIANLVLGRYGIVGAMARKAAEDMYQSNADKFNALFK